LPGHNKINCQECPLGTRKLSIFENTCDQCDLDTNTAEKKKYTVFNDCTKYECIDNRVQLNQAINPHCLTSFEVFSDHIISNWHMLTYILLVMLIMMIIATINRRYKFVEKLCITKKKKWIEETESYDKNFLVFSFLGDNIPSNQWFLEMDISKDFNTTLISRQDYLNLARVRFC
jgi:hypothetical protein